MSAFVCSDKHINAIATFCASQKVSVYHDGVTVEIHRHPQKLAETLLAENVASVNYRYQEYDKPEHVKYQPVMLPPIAVYKLCESLDYQSCEHPDWEKSFAFAALQKIKGAVIRALPEYEKSAWSI